MSHSHPQTPRAESVVDWHEIRRIIGGAIRAQLGHAEPGLIEDLTQQALIDLLRALRREPVRDVGSLAATIARTTAIDEIRRLQRERRGLVQLRVEAPESAIADANRSRLDHQLDALWFLLMEYLRRSQATCLPLALLYAEKGDWLRVSQVLGMSHGAVRKQWSRCTQAFRVALTREPKCFEEWLDHD